MIGKINLQVTAERANFPLGTLYVRAGSAANVELLEVPARSGVTIAGVFARILNADGTSADFSAVAVESRWVLDLPSSHFATPGIVPNGVVVFATGTGADGETARTWNIGVGDLNVLDADAGTPVSSVAWTALKLRDTLPTNPVKGDAHFSAGVLSVYDGAVWRIVGDVGWGNLSGKPTTFPPSAHTHAQGDVTGLTTALAARPTKTQIDAGWWSEWTISPTAPSGKYVIIIHDSANSQYNIWIGDSEDAWQDGPPNAWVNNATGNESTISFTLNGTPYTATRHRVAAPIPAKTSDLTNDSGFLTQHQQLVPVYSQTPTFSDWSFSGLPNGITVTSFYHYSNYWTIILSDGNHAELQGTANDTTVHISTRDWMEAGGNDVTATRTRTDILGYTLGSQSDKPLASEAEAETLRNGKANRAANPTTGNLAALDAQGNPTDSTIPAANVALKGNIPYDLGTPVVISAASSETVEGETVYYAAVTLANRTANIVQVTATLDELRITFPAATSGKVRDFGLRVETGTGSAALAAPALVPVAPTGETITLENADGEIPALADGTATAKGVTLLYFCETAPGVFVVKGEQVEEVA
ncbi:MAG: hypothetical protein K6G94_09640 [Kiritimatiellae bacterium]|nr:hypothetical protein [Kiritimatiellia bacterium]